MDADHVREIYPLSGYSAASDLGVRDSCGGKTAPYQGSPSGKFFPAGCILMTQPIGFKGFKKCIDPKFRQSPAWIKKNGSAENIRPAPPPLIIIGTLWLEHLRHHVTIGTGCNPE
jgi:hypothetical protein